MPMRFRNSSIAWLRRALVLPILLFLLLPVVACSSKPRREASCGPQPSNATRPGAPAIGTPTIEARFMFGFGCSSYGSKPGDFRAPFAIGVDDSDRIVVPDTGH